MIKANILRPERWDEPFGPDMTEVDVNRILSIPPFSRIDPNLFSPSASLHDILLNDTRIIQYRNGDIVVRKGDYGNSAFFIMKGAVRVNIDPPEKSIPESFLGRCESQRKGFWGALAQLWRNSRLPETRHSFSYKDDTNVATRKITEEEVRVFLQDVPGILERHKTVRIDTEEFFGEIAALGRTPRTATVFADGDVELLEIRWQGLRDIRRRVQEIKEHIDSIYRERSLKSHLSHNPMFHNIGEDELTEIVEQTSFETYGDFDWHGSYQSLVKKSVSERLQKEPVIVEEGHYPNGLIIIRSGFARVSQRFGHGQRTVSYLGHGQTYGLEEIVHNWRNDHQVPFQRTLRAIGYIDVLIVPVSIMEKFVLPSMPKELFPPPLIVTDDGESKKIEESKENIGIDFLEFLVENRFINGTATMIINQDRCVRCDDCVRACATAHGNNPRFIRHGAQMRHYMVANACMHCADPVCMIGCPTGAIHRNVAQGQVVINDIACIGCATCASSCPYNNIRMVQIRNQRGEFILDRETGAPIFKATKCDLCIDQPGGPACQRACPHDALRRIDMSNLESSKKWLCQ